MPELSGIDKEIIMKTKTTALALVLIMAVCLCACGKQTRESDKTLYSQGLDTIALMNEMTHAQGYLELYAGNGDIMKVVGKMRAGDYSKPSAVYSISANSEELVNMFAPGSLDGMSEELKNTVCQKVFYSLVTQINGMSGAAGLAASSVCVAQKTFVNKELESDLIYLYTYENALPVAVVFTKGEDGAATASGSFIVYDGFVCASADEVESNFSGFELSVEEIAPEGSSKAS